MAKLKVWLPVVLAAAAFGTFAAPHFLPSGDVAIAAPKEAPDFSLPRTGDGKTVKLSDFKGKVRIVNFWATWCPPCRAEIPHFVSMYKDLKGKGVEIIGISLDQKGDAAVAPFVKENKMNYPVLLGDENVVSAYGGIRGIPTTFIVDRQGRIVKKFVGLPASSEEGIKDAFMKEIGPLL
ncbi:MAG TPA: TlpA disulfide reductase family protein [Stenomitos sp.]